MLGEYTTSVDYSTSQTDHTRASFGYLIIESVADLAGFLYFSYSGKGMMITFADWEFSGHFHAIIRCRSIIPPTERMEATTKLSIPTNHWRCIANQATTIGQNVCSQSIVRGKPRVLSFSPTVRSDLYNMLPKGHVVRGLSSRVT